MKAFRDRIAAWLLRTGLRLLGATWRFHEEVPGECRSVLDGRDVAVVAFWHGKMVPVWYRFRGGHAAALVSGSRDGELLAGYLQRSLGYGKVIRGSSSRGGGEALAGVVEALREMSCLMTPDGPRGPSRHAKAGALVAARRGGRGVMLAGWTCRWRIRLKSWDAMEIPYPFSRIHFRYCKIDPDRFRSERLTDEDLREFSRLLEEVGSD